MEPDFDLSFTDLLAQIQNALPPQAEPVAYHPAPAKEPAEPKPVDEPKKPTAAKADEPVAYHPAPAEEPTEPKPVDEPEKPTAAKTAEPVAYHPAPAEEPAEPKPVDEPEKPTAAKADESVAYHPTPAEESAGAVEIAEEVALAEEFKIYMETEEAAEAELYERDDFEATPVEKGKPEPRTGRSIDPSAASDRPAQRATEKTVEIHQSILKRAEEKPSAERELDQSKTQTVALNQIQEAPLFFERSGIVTVKRNLYDKTDDLSAVPAIMAAEDALNQLPEPESVSEEPTLKEESAQMVFPDFIPDQSTRVYMSDDEAENELKENRNQKVESFRLEGVEEKEKELNGEIIKEITENGGEGLSGGKRFSLIKARARANRQRVEYNRPQDRAKIIRFLNKKHTITLASTIVCAVCGFGLIFTGAIPAVAESLNAGFSPQWLGSMPASCFFSLLLLIVCAFAGAPIYSRGVTCFFNGSGKPNACTSVLAALAACFIQLIAASFSPDGGSMPCFALLGAASVVLFGVGQLISLSDIAKNFLFLSALDRGELYAADTIVNTADIKRLAQDSVIGDADIRYSAKAKFAANFLSYAFAGDSTDDLCAWLTPAGAAASFVLAVIVGLAKKDVTYAFSIFSCAMCMSVPVSAAIAIALPLSRTNSRLRDDGAFLSSYAAAFEYETTNVVAVDASDLFPAECCDIHGMKPFGGVRIDEAILTAASMILAVGGPIGTLLSNVVMGRKELLLPVEELIYEDRLGLSGWIRGRCVVLGNRRMMEHHNIEIPPEAKESRYARGGRRVLYLADNGKLIALFVVSYGTDVRIAENVRKIEESGINLLVRATDPNITEKSIAMTFGIPVSSIKVVSNAASEVLTAYAERVNPRLEAKLVHNGSPLAFLHAVRAAGRLCGVAGRINAQLIACCAAGLLIVAILSLITASVSPLAACLCQLVWVLIGLAVPLAGRD